ncbi:MarR family winged helix-turn-helix transcriptional regulator [Frondihabitans australicus]|uniref:DNA-binding MarR family transcriptional regulator n=1 Tax=Frondihabitans australicus TaxID=386892 RepID=A0A495ILU6_9MICO|nr:MarR family transcriptional regulator [Frondihabitans australicus]RKR76231.1 DNA-binding MarR family transcriptional regulator [Frondihabitans australicus]
MNDEPEIELTSALGLLRWIGWAQMKAGSDWTQERDLTQQQSFALGYLVQNPGSIQKDIATITRTTPASVSSLLSGLEARGLIERRTEDGNERSKRVYATAEGAAMIDGFDEFVQQLEDQILSPLDDDERQTLIGLLTKITARLPRPTR